MMGGFAIGLRGRPENTSSGASLALQLAHTDPDCTRAFRADPAPGPEARVQRIHCDGCGASYPAAPPALLALAREHLFASRLILATLPGRIALLRERQADNATRPDPHLQPSNA
jgi:hypothetical protein